jgi:hypothetical protein
MKLTRESRLPLIEVVGKYREKTKTRSSQELRNSIHKKKNMVFARNMSLRHISSFLGTKTKECVDVEDFIRNNTFEVINERLGVNDLYQLVSLEIVTLNDLFEYREAITSKETQNFILNHDIVILHFLNFKVAVLISKDGSIIKYGSFTRDFNYDPDTEHSYTLISIIDWDDSWIIKYLPLAKGRKHSKKSKR